MQSRLDAPVGCQECPPRDIMSARFEMPNFMLWGRRWEMDTLVWSAQIFLCTDYCDESWLRRGEVPDRSYLGQEMLSLN